MTFAAPSTTYPDSLNDGENIPLLAFGDGPGLGLAIDCTGSMTGVLAALTAFWAGYLIRYSASREDQGKALETISLVGYGDHEDNPACVDDTPPIPWLRLQKTTDNLEEAIYHLGQLLPVGGQDQAECPACAADLLRQMVPHGTQWLVADAAAHGQRIDSFKMSSDTIICPVYKNQPPRDIYRGINVLWINHAGECEEDTVRLWKEYGANRVITISQNELIKELCHDKNPDGIEKAKERIYAICDELGKRVDAYLDQLIADAAT